MEEFKVNKSLGRFYDGAFDQNAAESATTFELKSLDHRYEAEEFLAEGGMKTVSKCKDQITDRTIAKGCLKNLKSHDCTDKFINEVRITASLEHPNIIPIYDLSFNENDEPFFTMKLIEGDNLQEILNRLDDGCEETLAKYNIDSMLEIFLKVCDAIEFAHAKGVLHLDLKPSNIQIGNYGEVIVCDWGLAQKVAEVEPEDRDESIVVGSPGYMAPEQIKCSIGKVSEITDIYSLGAILYFMLTHKPLIDYGAVNTALIRTLTGEYTHPNEANKTLSVPPGLSAVIEKCLEVKPASRYQSVKALKKEIRSYRNGFATNAENANQIKLLSLLLRRNKLVSFLGLLCIFLGIFFYVRLSFEKGKADALVEDLKLEKAHKQIISKSSAKKLMLFANNLYKNKKYDHAFSYIESAVKLDPEISKTWHLPMYYYFGKLDLINAKKAAQILELESNKWFLETIDLLPPISTFTSEQSYELLKSIPKMHFRGYLIDHLYHTITNSYPLEDRIAFAEFTYKKLSFPFELNRTDQKFSFSLRGQAQLKELREISNLPITHLDLSGTGIKDISLLENLPLVRLDM